MFLNIIMFQSRIILIFLLFCLSQFVKIDGQSFNYYSFTYHKCSNRSADLVGNSVYKQNLNKLFRTLSKRASVIRFYNTTVGESREKVYGLFQCAEKYANLDCPNCIGFAIDEIVQLCPSYDEAIVWDKNCMLRYAKRPIFSVPEVAPLQVDLESYESSLNRPQFESSALSIKMRDLINNASFSNTSIHFAHHKIKLMPYSFDTYAQCTRDLNGIQCKSCLDSALTELHTCCKSIIDGNIFMPSCQLWKQFVYHDDGAADAPVPIDNSGKPLGAPVIAGLITILVGTVLLFNALLCYLQWRRRTKNRSKDIHNELPDGEVKEIRSLKDLQFDFHTIKAATKNFAEDKKLGEGGFGEVYKGKLKNGREIAVKMLSKNSEQGTKEFKNEVLLLAKLQHRHLVQLLGFCISGKEKMLIYELVPNSSLDCFLFDPHKSSSLDWQTRLRIIDGVARGILYLHEDSRLKIIHRDLKTSNILLDQVLNAKISDFGLAKLFALDETQGCTTRVVGTYGYMAPEYAMAGQFSVKSDVYSFGVIVLEIISGQKNRVFQQQPNEEALLYRAWILWNEDAALELVDPIIRKNTINDADEILICIHIALLCIQEDPTNRPRMASVVAALNGQSISLPPPLSPHFFRVSPATYTDLSSYDSNSGNEIQSLSVQSLTDEYSRTISQIMG